MNAVCVRCGSEFVYGETGVWVSEEEPEVCDICAGIVRAANGFALDQDAAFTRFVPISRFGSPRSRVHPGDAAMLHPHRKLP